MSILGLIILISLAVVCLWAIKTRICNTRYVSCSTSS